MLSFPLKINIQLLPNQRSKTILCFFYSIRNQTLVYQSIIAVSMLVWRQSDLMKCSVSRSETSNLFQWNGPLISKDSSFQMVTGSDGSSLSDWKHVDISSAQRLNRRIDCRLATTSILLLLPLLGRNLKVAWGRNTCRPLLPDCVGHDFTAGGLTNRKTCRMKMSDKRSSTSMGCVSQNNYEKSA